MTINQMIQICFGHGLDGRDTDTCVKSMAGNVLKPNMPVVSIEMPNQRDLLRMMKTADNTHIYIGGGVFHFNAFYAVANNFPAPRIYYMKMVDLMTVGTLCTYLQKNGIVLLPMNDEKFSPLIEDKQYAERYERWHMRWEANNKAFMGLLDGRVKNTAVEQGIWLSSDGGCMVCGDKTDLMATATVIGKQGIMLGLQLCSKHEAEAKNHSALLNYISEKMGVPAPFLAGAKVQRHGEQIIDMTCEAVRNELNCVIEKIDGQTITAVRKSGFRVIIRQDAINDYAYNIQDPSKKSISRIDSADHHKVEYGPDHVHRDLSKSKKNQVEPSFTYGFAVADLKAIRQLLESAEARWAAS